MKQHEFTEIKYFDGCFDHTRPLEHQIYIGNDEMTKEPKFVEFVCPCGCGHSVFLRVNSTGDGDHIWKIEKHDDGTISLYNSILMTIGCHSHFYVKHNKVEWCK